MTSIIRAQNQIVRLVRASNGCIKRPLSISCNVLDMEEFYKHRRQQMLLEKIRDEAKRNFDPRAGKFFLLFLNHTLLLWPPV